MSVESEHLPARSSLSARSLVVADVALAKVPRLLAMNRVARESLWWTVQIGRFGSGVPVPVLLLLFSPAGVLGSALGIPIAAAGYAAAVGLATRRGTRRLANIESCAARLCEALLAGEEAMAEFESRHLLERLPLYASPFEDTYTHLVLVPAAQESAMGRWTDSERWRLEAWEAGDSEKRLLLEATALRPVYARVVARNAVGLGDLERCRALLRRPRALSSIGEYTLLLLAYSASKGDCDEQHLEPKRLYS